MEETARRREVVASALREVARLEPDEPERKAAEVVVVEGEKFYQESLLALRERFEPYMDFKDWRGRS